MVACFQRFVLFAAFYHNFSGVFQDGKIISQLRLAKFFSVFIHQNEQAAARFYFFLQIFSENIFISVGEKIFTSVFHKKKLHGIKIHNLPRLCNFVTK